MAPYRIEWMDEAQADVRRLDRDVALQIVDANLRFSRTGAGDVAPLHGDLADLIRPRSGDYRILFKLIAGVRHRSQAYH